ncbi:hypothetical protein SLS62_008621 [Diatrype stigma]|uniref:Uncharacterized protein n=1 Tax=Diatrype stigma TaxID=117547 RepID=A0AAN9UTQ3_9PEZI
MCANWIGYAGSFAPYGEAQWRVPLALQLPWGMILFFNLCTFMPKSPRELIQKGKIEEARQAFSRIRPDLHSHEVLEEFGLMKAQIEYETEPTLYKSLGIDKKTVLALAAAWGTCAFVSNAIANNFLPDRFGRRK